VLWDRVISIPKNSAVYKFRFSRKDDGKMNNTLTQNVVLGFGVRNDPWHIRNSRTSQPSSKMPWKFHDYSMSFIQVLFVFHAQTWHGFWTSSSHRISMALSKKMMEFLSDSVSFSNQTKLPPKRHEKIPVTFFTGMMMLIKWLILHKI